MVASAAQRCLDGAGTHFRHSRYFLDAHLLQVEECDAGLLALAQHADGAVQGAQFDALNQKVRKVREAVL